MDGEVEFEMVLVDFGVVLVDFEVVLVDFEMDLVDFGMDLVDFGMDLVDFEVDLVLAQTVGGVGVVGGSGSFAWNCRFVGGDTWFTLRSTPVLISVAAKHEKVTSHPYLRQPT